MADGKHADDGYGPPLSEEVAKIRDEFLVWPRPYQNADKPPPAQPATE